jgi:hypothetical protein
VLKAIDGGFLAGLFGVFGIHFHDFAVRRLGEVSRAAPVSREHGNGAGMVRVLVSNKDGIDPVGTRAAEGLKAAENFLAAEASVDEESGVLGFEQRGVARATGSEN